MPVIKRLTSCYYNVTFILQTNTFQGMVITNGYQSYAVFTYRCTLLQWSRSAAIGFKAAGDFHGNISLGANNASAFACQNSPVSSWNNVIFQLRKS